MKRSWHQTSRVPGNPVGQYLPNGGGDTWMAHSSGGGGVHPTVCRPVQHQQNLTFLYFQCAFSFRIRNFAKKINGRSKKHFSIPGTVWGDRGRMGATPFRLSFLNAAGGSREGGGLQAGGFGVGFPISGTLSHFLCLRVRCNHTGI